MPTGRMRWFDSAADKGCVARGGKEYPVLSGEAERDAQARRAPVHFDIRRQDGIEWAVHVRLCQGTRVDHLQHRFGDLVGRRSHSVPDERDPSTLATLWLEAVAHGDPGAASLLYAPEACVHAADATIRGRERIRQHLARDPIFARTFSATQVHSEDERTVVVHWKSGDGGSLAESHLRVDRGEIVEQWF